MKNVFATLILVHVLYFEAFPQYEKLVKGQPTTFDTAVAVRIDRYREEGLKLQLGEQLVDSLTNEVFSLYREQDLHSSEVKALDLTINHLVIANERKDSVNQQLKQYFRRLDDLNQDQKKVETGAKIFFGAWVAVELIKLFVGR